MYKLSTKNLEIDISINEGVISSLRLNGKERLADKCPIFKMRLRNLEGDCTYIDATMAKSAFIDGECLIFKDFDSVPLTVIIKTCATDDEILWYASVQGMPNECALEWIEVAKACLPKLIDNNENGGKILFPYDEGILLTDESLLPRYEPEFPMSGAYFIFPNKLCSQFMAYLFDDIGLYIGAHDKNRAFKGIDFYPQGEGISLHVRLYSGLDYGMDYCCEFPIVWKACGNSWQGACEIYRLWFENNLPYNLTKISENKALPNWYKEAPLIVTYPVRGIHDMDKMNPNALFPYTNALPILNTIKRDTGCQIMALLMHWEGTAPWAPPYVWPPYGGEGVFNEFRDELHKNGDLLGVYCSGFGYTTQSTLIDEYNCEKKIEDENVLDGVCHSPQNNPELGITCCPYQRYGYDICPASSRGQEILNEAYEPLFSSGVDYAQILDQNHGGGQYMCYARGHNHPPMPGKWMTTNMQELLGKWNKLAPNMLFGCESAASEPFIGSLLMSDNRFELNYPYGTVVPAYAYIYHEYVRNFMGNQCGTPFDTKIDTLRYRLAYSFSVGDIMTLVLAPNGELMTHWSTRDFDNPPNMELALRFIKNMREFYEGGAKKYLYNGKMALAPDICCESIQIPMLRGKPYATLPALPSTAWKRENGGVAYIVVNPENKVASFTLENESFEIAPLSAILIEK